MNESKAYFVIPTELPVEAGKVFWKEIKKSGEFVLQRHKSSNSIASGIVSTMKTMWSTNGSSMYRILLKTPQNAYEVVLSSNKEDIEPYWKWIYQNLQKRDLGDKITDEHKPHFYLALLNARYQSAVKNDLSEFDEKSAIWEDCLENYSKGFLSI